MCPYLLKTTCIPLCISLAFHKINASVRNARKIHGMWWGLESGHTEDCLVSCYESCPMKVCHWWHWIMSVSVFTVCHLHVLHFCWLVVLYFPRHGSVRRCYSVFAHLVYFMNATWILCMYYCLLSVCDNCKLVVYSRLLDSSNIASMKTWATDSLDFQRLLFQIMHARVFLAEVVVVGWYATVNSVLAELLPELWSSVNLKSLTAGPLNSCFPALLVQGDTSSSYILFPGHSIPHPC